MTTLCPICLDGYPRIVVKPGGQVTHEVLGFSWKCWDQSTATEAEKRDDLRQEIQNSGDC